MRNRQVIFLLGLTLVTVFVLAVAWELVIEDSLGGYLGADHGNESLAQRWEFVITATAFAGLALIVPTLISFRIVAQRRRAERKLEELNEALERRVQERTAALEKELEERRRTEIALVAAKRSAERANAVKSQFLANISHEIRTPLNGILSLTELLLTTTLEDQQRRLAQNAHRSGELLLNIISDLLDFAKIEAGTLRLESVPFDLRKAIEDTLELFAPAAHAKGLELTLTMAPETSPWVLGDPFRIRQILNNLLGNAIKFTDRGEVVVCCTLDDRNREDSVLRLAVRDTGIGIAAADQARLFNPFVQADGSSTRRYGGAGLGLAISKNLATLMDGDIGLESEPGSGSTFWVTLRVGPAERPSTMDDVLRDALRGLRLLIVDDNETSRRALQEQADAWGMRTTALADGATAVKRMAAAAQSGTPFDLALVDLMMPGMDGIDVARSVKADPALGSTPLIMLVPGGIDHDTEAARRVGVLTCLNKPIRQSHLHQCLLTALDQELVAHPPPTHTTVPAVKLQGHVLLAEDNPVNAEATLCMLRILGCDVTLARDGNEALEAFSRGRYAAVLMDCGMPEMDGLEAAAEIRRREQAQAVDHTPIIALTAHAMQGDRERCIAAGMDDYLSKPVNLAQLAEALQRWLAAPRVQPAAPGAIWAARH